ncbi:hypothetical protein [Aeromicrobium sp.]|uniref:hypothetical protein n=1 Tax=Aeromicrobium sp. TaxID=1871063 RepID=UPI002FC62DAB
MTTVDQPELTYPSAPIEGDTKATVDLVANDWRSDYEWRAFVEAVESRALWPDGDVYPDDVRDALMGSDGELTINPRRLSAFYSRAVSCGLLVFSHWGINGDTKGRNAGRPARIYRLAAS